MREIFFLGVGNFGYSCAVKLQGKADVTVIDNDRDRIQQIGHFVNRAILGDATQKELLSELGVDAADAAVVSLGDKIGSSILATLHLASLKVPEIYAKSISDEHTTILKLVGATRVINPEREVAENLAISLVKADVVDYLRLHEEFGIIELNAPQRFWGRDLIEINMRSRYQVTLIAVLRQSGERLTNPSPDTVIQEGDKLILLGEEEQVLQFHQTLGDE